MDAFRCFTMPLGYSARYSACEGGVYWHLFFGGERVNGGIAGDDFEAGTEAACHAQRHRSAQRDIGLDPLDLDLFADLAAWRLRKANEQHA